MKLRKIVIAALIGVCSTNMIYADTQGEGVKEGTIKEATVVDTSINNGVKLSLEKVVVDGYSVKVVYGLEKVDGTAFVNAKGMDILKNTLAIDGMPMEYPKEAITGEIKDFSSSIGYVMSSYKDAAHPNKQYVALYYADYRPIVKNANATLTVNGIIEEDYVKVDTKFDIAQYISSRSNNNQVKTIANVGATMGENQLSKLLVSQGLKLKLHDRVDSPYIESLGFVDGRLHIKVISNMEDPTGFALTDLKGNIVTRKYTNTQIKEVNGQKIKEMYIVYDIKDSKVLKNYKVKTTTTKVVEEIPGEWCIKFKLPEATKAKTQVINKPINYDDITEATLADVTFTDESLIVKVTGIQAQESQNKLVLKWYAKGAEVPCYELPASTCRRGNEQIYVYTPGHVDEWRNIKTIQLNGTVVELKR